MRGVFPCFIDTEAWIALAITSDPYHEQAQGKWQLVTKEGCWLYTSIPVVLETFTFLDRNTKRIAGPYGHICSPT
jgi:hypothetical protein